MRRKIQKYLSGEREGFSLIELTSVAYLLLTDAADLNAVATSFNAARSVDSLELSR